MPNIKKNLTSEQFDTFAEDLLAERSERPLIIVGASKVDELLFEILRLFFLPKIAKDKRQDELLEGETPLATFSARIKVCRRLGLIDETLYLCLEKLRALRNLSAHSIWFVATDSPARDHILELKKRIQVRHSFRLTKDRYFDGIQFTSIEELQCLLLTLCVLLEAVRKKVVQTTGNKSALSISAR